MSKLADLEKRRSSATAEAAAAAVAEAETVRRPSMKNPPTASPQNSVPSSEDIARTTLTIPVDLLEAVDARLARLGRRQRVSFSGYVEASLRELLARGDDDVEALERYGIAKRRKLYSKNT